MEIWYNFHSKNKGEHTVNQDTVTISRAEYEELRKANDELRQANEDLSKQVSFLMQQIALARQQRFGSSSEKSKYDDGSEQLSFLFNEIEVYADSSSVLKEPDLTTVKEHKRNRKHLTRETDLPEDIETEVVNRDVPESERTCSVCGEQMEWIGEDVIRRLKIVPAKYVVVETHIQKYRCGNCQKNGADTHIVEGKTDPPVIPGSNAEAEAISYVATEKFVMYAPLYRMEQQCNRIGIPLSRQTMSNWLLRASELWLEPIWNLMHLELLKEDIAHADETTVQVLNEPGRKAQSKSYMWLYRTGKEARQQLVLYEYQKTRGAEHPENFLKGFEGYLHTDGYAGYHKLPAKIRVVGCLAHARRKFEEALKVLPENDRKDSAAQRGVRYYDALFHIEEQIKDLSPEERRVKRNELARPILNELHDWAFRLNAAPKSLLGKAAHYTREQWQWLVGYLEDGRLEASNNRAERSIKPFVMSRKNFLFANTPSGAKASAIYFSLIETAKENGLDPYRYLTWVLKTAPKLKAQNLFEEKLSSLLPMNAPADCRTGKKTTDTTENS